jgi:signal transduction histidine kinase
VDINALLLDIVDVLAPPPGFEVILTESVPIFVGERVPLEMALRNLIENAIKHHTNPAQGRVTVSVQAREQWLEFAVSDNGPGIDPKFHERIFGIFETLKPHGQGEGSGVGLTVVKKLVEMRGGAVQVDSSLGAGATFRFTWPKS